MPLVSTFVLTLLPHRRSVCFACKVLSIDWSMCATENVFFRRNVPVCPIFLQLLRMLLAISFSITFAALFPWLILRSFPRLHDVNVSWYALRLFLLPHCAPSCAMYHSSLFYAYAPTWGIALSFVYRSYCPFHLWCLLRDLVFNTVNTLKARMFSIKSVLHVSVSSARLVIHLAYERYAVHLDWIPSDYTFNFHCFLIDGFWMRSWILFCLRRSNYVHVFL